MMAVGDVERRQRVDGAGQRADLRLIVQHPELVPHAVVGDDVDRGRALGGARKKRVDLGRLGIGEHHRAGLRADRLDLAHPVVLLGVRRQLVLADAVVGVSAERRDRGETGLDALAPSQPVDVVAGLVVAHEHAGVDHAPQISAAFA